ncbi:hypothetical protein [Arthrobacter bambusae]|uniref:Uncharacterized protein n=1 Tax=Arthrobacter bambusae TaxID=1338426 RepID=A0AAW8DGT8_9MICC|nr:hypothetical protein [Arthrobacter bambusae]MDP9904585.1 hypothetical protein [Arthrobacter bambusae]MDQ0129401.1 hypothetical protein [Arthrobacter bambusae]MDQ0180986.1 hypothetical protein [Arthrobacter bambusae]
MSNAELETQYQNVPERIRQRIEERLNDAAIGLKLKIGMLLDDREERAAHAVAPAGRIGLKSGQVSELTIIVPLKPKGAERLRRLFGLLDGNLVGAGQVGTLHNMRFVFLDDDTKLLFATAYDGEWDPYIDDFATKIPEMMDFIFGNVEGWPGIQSPEVKDFIVQYQIPAAAWFVAHPTVTVAEGSRLLEQDANVHAFVEKLN